jgi:hypothetical protein
VVTGDCAGISPSELLEGQTAPGLPFLRQLHWESPRVGIDLEDRDP